MRDYVGTISIDMVDFWTWIFSTFSDEISDNDPHYVVDWSTWKDECIIIRDDYENELEIDLTDFIIWVASNYMASAYDEFIFEPPIEKDGYIEIKFKASSHCDPRTWNNECIITGTYICPHKEISMSTKCSSCKIVDRVSQRQDSSSDQLRDLIMIANKAGMYDAADILSNLLSSSTTSSSKGLSPTNNSYPSKQFAIIKSILEVCGIPDGLDDSMLLTWIDNRDVADIIEHGVNSTRYLCPSYGDPDSRYVRLISQLWYNIKDKFTKGFTYTEFWSLIIKIEGMDKEFGDKK